MSLTQFITSIIFTASGLCTLQAQVTDPALTKMISEVSSELQSLNDQLMAGSVRGIQNNLTNAKRALSQARYEGQDEGTELHPKVVEAKSYIDIALNDLNELLSEAEIVFEHVFQAKSDYHKTSVHKAIDKLTVGNYKEMLSLHENVQEKLYNIRAEQLSASEELYDLRVAKVWEDPLEEVIAMRIPGTLTKVIDETLRKFPGMPEGSKVHVDIRGDNALVALSVPASNFTYDVGSYLDRYTALLDFALASSTQLEHGGLVLDSIQIKLLFQDALQDLNRVGPGYSYSGEFGGDLWIPLLMEDAESGVMTGNGIRLVKGQKLSMTDVTGLQVYAFKQQIVAKSSLNPKDIGIKLSGPNYDLANTRTMLVVLYLNYLS